MNFKKEFSERGMLERVFKFECIVFKSECFDERIISFSTQQDEFMMEVNIISDDYFSRNMTGKQLVDMKNITYVSFTTYKIPSPCLEVIEKVDYNNGKQK